MNFLRIAWSVALLLTISLQSQAMLRNFASKVAARMPASMMRNVKPGMPTLAQRTFATAKPAAKSWTKPMMARAAMLGGGSAMAVAVFQLAGFKKFPRDSFEDFVLATATAAITPKKMAEGAKAEVAQAVPANPAETQSQFDVDLAKLLQDYQTCREKVRDDLKHKPGFVYPQWYNPERDKINLDNKLHACYVEHVKNLVKFLKANQVAQSPKQTPK